MREEIFAITSRYPAYHDFSLGNLYCWNTDDSLEICLLNNNLVVKFPDYLNNSKHYLSFLGDNQPQDTAKQLIEYSTEKFRQSYMRYVPEVSIESLERNDAFMIEPNRDDFDYVFETKKYLNFDGHILSKVKSEYGHFYKKNKPSLKVETFQDISDTHWGEIREIFKVWLSSKPHPEQFDQEKIAIEKMATLPANFLKHWAMLVYLNDKPVGFTVYEIKEDWAICHFAKADMQFPHIFNYVFIESFRKLAEANINHINLEPDLGIEGLRISKERKHPSGFLKKYTVSLKKS